MLETSTAHDRWSKVNGGAVVNILGRVISGPDMVGELGEQLRSLLQSGEMPAVELRSDPDHDEHGLAMRPNLWKAVSKAHAELRTCSMGPSVRFGADVLRVGEYVPTQNDETSALAASARGRAVARDFG
jgi:hypothetical protein